RRPASEQVECFLRARPTLHPPIASVGGKASPLGSDPRSLQGQELADVGPTVHSLHATSARGVEGGSANTPLNAVSPHPLRTRLPTRRHRCCLRQRTRGRRGGPE